MQEQRTEFSWLGKRMGLSGKGSLLLSPICTPDKMCPGSVCSHDDREGDLLWTCSEETEILTQ